MSDINKKRENRLITALNNNGLTKNDIRKNISNTMNKYLETGRSKFLDIIVRDTKLYLKLKERGLELRSDSILCESYINEGDCDIEFVIDNVIKMKWFMENSSYNKHKNEIIIKINFNYIFIIPSFKPLFLFVIVEFV
jgi:hypothetical protein